MSKFIEVKPKTESIWRSIILFGRNVATCKFALGKSLIEIATQEKSFLTLEDLAEPFSRNIVEHLKLNDKQGISSGSKFLDKCREFNDGRCSRDELLTITEKLGFINVIDAFHIVGKGEVPKRFFIDERKDRNGINITDELFKLKEQLQFSNLSYEVEARWRLVETAWSLNISPSLLEVKYDKDNQLLFTQKNEYKRINITSCKYSLNGYQKGKCFYCFKEVLVEGNDKNRVVDVDHFFPHILKPLISDVNFDGVWNLVLACTDCNRGVGGKFESIPKAYLLQRLHTRNEYLINSHHPLRETLIRQTGKTENIRRIFLQKVDEKAIGFKIHRWGPKEENETEF